MELRYKIKEIPDEGLRVSQAIPADLLKDALEGLAPDLAQSSGGIELLLTRVKRDMVVSGRVSAALSLACGACLKPAAVTVRAPVNVVYVEGDENEPTDENDDDLDAEDVLHYDGE